MRARYESGKHELVIKHCDFIMKDRTIIELPENVLAYTSAYYYHDMSHLETSLRAACKETQGDPVLLVPRDHASTAYAHLHMYVVFICARGRQD